MFPECIFVGQYIVDRIIVLAVVFLRAGTREVRSPFVEIVDFVFNQVLREIHAIVQTFQKWKIDIGIEVPEQIIAFVHIILLDCQ